MFKDPICGMTVSNDTTFKITRDGKEYGFCSGGCRDTFLSRPAAGSFSAVSSVSRFRALLLNRTLLSLVLAFLLVGAGGFLRFLQPASVLLADYLQMRAWPLILG